MSKKYKGKSLGNDTVHKSGKIHKSDNKKMNTEMLKNGIQLSLNEYNSDDESKDSLFMNVDSLLKKVKEECNSSNSENSPEILNTFNKVKYNNCLMRSGSEKNVFDFGSQNDIGTGTSKFALDIFSGYNSFILNNKEHKSTQTCIFDLGDVTILSNQMTPTDFNSEMDYIITRLKLGISVHGCNFTKISTELFGSYERISPKILYDIFRQLIVQQ